MFATKPQLTESLLDHAQSLGIRAAFVVGDEVYGGRELRRGIRQRGMGYVLAIRSNHIVSTSSANPAKCQVKPRALTELAVTSD
jgi:SRSO17 transposase